MDDVVIYGAGGFGSEVLDILHQAGQYRPVAFLDSDTTKHGRTIAGLPVRGGLNTIEELRRDGLSRIVVAIGDNVARAANAETLQANGMELVAAIHPLASISPSARIAQHVIIGARATICVHAHVGPHAVLSPGTIVEHDNSIGVAAFLGPAVRLAGGVTVDDFAFLEIGASVIPGCKVGQGARVRAGAVVIRNVPPNSLVSGVPAEADWKGESRFIPDPTTTEPAVHSDSSAVMAPHPTGAISHAD